MIRMLITVVSAIALAAPAQAWSQGMPGAAKAGAAAKASDLRKTGQRDTSPAPIGGSFPGPAAKPALKLDPRASVKR